MASLKSNKLKIITMKIRLINRSITIIFIAILLCNFASGQTIDPANPNATPEARALLKYIRSISGKYILSGQHNYPATGDRNTQFAADYIGKTPVVWSQDFGFAREGDKDSYLSRPAIIQEAIRQYKKGAIINLCWHAVPPTADEPVTFQPLPGRDPGAPLASVQGRLTDKQFQDILTPGTELYKKWVKQVDEIAKFLKQLQDAKVPVLWRPYHEMNGDWFWWGGRYEGKYTTAALYRQIFDRMVKYHKLNNLIWIWSVDRPSRADREFVKYYPGTKYLDILAIDIYGNDFNQSYYDGLMALSEGKPITLAEVGNPPSIEVINKQPNWVYWVVWAGMVRGTSVADYEKLLKDPGVVFMEEPSYINSTREYRKACGLEPLTLNLEADFTGEWKMNECESVVQPGRGGVSTPYKLSIVQKGNVLNIKSFTISEYSDDEVSEQALTLDGKDNMSTGFMNAPRVQNAVWTVQKDTLTINSRVTLNYGGRTNEVKSKEIWALKKRGKKLVIDETSPGSMGGASRTNKLVYDRQ
jgi:mannan endo-1,4-beta-mannosidase